MATIAIIAICFIVLYFCWPLIEALGQVLIGLLMLAWCLAIGLVCLILPFVLLGWLL